MKQMGLSVDRILYACGNKIHDFGMVMIKPM